MVLLVIVRFKYAAKLQKICGNFIFLIRTLVLFKFQVNYNLIFDTLSLIQCNLSYLIGLNKPASYLAETAQV